MENKTYYFSSKGHFGGDGSKESPFCNLHEAKKLDIHPGDSLLLERGSVFENDSGCTCMTMWEPRSDPLW